MNPTAERRCVRRDVWVAGSRALPPRPGHTLLRAADRGARLRGGPTRRGRGAHPVGHLDRAVTGHVADSTVRASTAFDPATGTVVLFGGTATATTTYYGDTWTWNGTTWTELSPATAPRPALTPPWPTTRPPARWCCSAGPTPPAPPGRHLDLERHHLDRTVPGHAARPPGAYASMAYDPATGDMVLFGGYGPAAPWPTPGPGTAPPGPSSRRPSPPARGDASMAYDPATGQLVLFGG